MDADARDSSKGSSNKPKVATAQKVLDRFCGLKEDRIAMDCADIASRSGESGKDSVDYAQAMFANACGKN